MLNKTLIIGNLTKDPELRYTPSGTAVGTLRLACNRKFKAHGTGELKEEVCYISVVVWGKQAENCNTHLKKGQGVLIDGRLQSRSWEKDGVKHYTIEICAEYIQYLDRTKEGTDPEGGEGPDDSFPGEG